jgi:hypothetical protein
MPCALPEWVCSMTCDEFLAFIEADPKSCSMDDVGLAHQHFTECDVCKDALGLNENAQKWRNAWDRLRTDSHNDIGFFLAVVICILLGIFLFWSFVP